MLPHQQRVVDEKAELDERLRKLRAFLTSPTYNNLAHDEQQRLQKQSRLMSELSAVLLERIEAFN